MICLCLFQGNNLVLVHTSMEQPVPGTPLNVEVDMLEVNHLMFCSIQGRESSTDSQNITKPSLQKINIVL